MTFINPMNFLDPMFLLGVLNERQDFGDERPKYIGQRFFPRRNVPEQTLLWETQRRENRLAGVYSAKGKAVPGDEIGFQTFWANLLWIKASKHLDPDTVMKMRDPGMVNVYKEGQSAFVIQGIADRVASKMGEYIQFCDDQIAATEEYFALRAMQSRMIWPPRDENGMKINSPMPEWNAEQKIGISWPFTSEFVYKRKDDPDEPITERTIADLKGVAWRPGLAERSGAGYLWSDTANANPVKDLAVLSDLMLDLKGVDANNATIVMSQRVLSAWMENSKIREWLFGKNYEAAGAQSLMNWNTLKTKVKDSLGYDLLLYDAKWTYLDGVDSAGKDIIRSVRFLPASRIIIVPKAEKIGVMAQAPHENQNGDFVYGPNTWIHRDELPPYERQMGIDNIIWPLLQQPEGIGVFDVL